MSVVSGGRQRDGLHRRQEEAKNGFDYVHSMVDDHTRIAYSEIHPEEQGGTCAGFITRPGEFFASLGVSIERVMTDNYWSYIKTTAGADAITGLGATHKRIRPHCPWQNGKVERFNRTLQIEWAYRQVFESNNERSAALPDFLHRYNHQRRHHALEGRPPHQPAVTNLTAEYI